MKAKDKFSHPKLISTLIKCKAKKNFISCVPYMHYTRDHHVKKKNGNPSIESSYADVAGC